MKHAATDVEQPAQSRLLPVVPEADSVADADVARGMRRAPRRLTLTPPEELAALEDGRWRVLRRLTVGPRMPTRWKSAGGERCAG